MRNRGLIRLVKNIELTRDSVKESFLKIMRPHLSDMERSRAISKNFFLHIHSAKIHKYSLLPGFTLGLGLIAFFLFIILTFTGILLMVYYTPSVEGAYYSIKDIIFIVSGGRFIRNMHRWAAQAMVVVVLLHMTRVFYNSAYKKLRRINWLIGIGLLLATLLFSFSGYLLPWDQLAYWAITIASNIAASTNELTDALKFTQFPDSGKLIKILLLGAESVGQESLNRFYLLHVILLPLITTILIGFHFWRIRKAGGLTLPEDADERILHMEELLNLKVEPADQKSASKKKLNQNILSWPTLIWVELAVFMLVLASLMIFSYYFDAPMREFANPDVPENPAKSPWYFLGLQELVSYSAFGGGIIIPFLLIVALLLIPYLDREERYLGIWFSTKQGRLVFLYSLVYSIILTIAIIAFTINLGWIRNWFPEVPQILIIFINPGTIITLIYVIWSLAILRKTASTRMAAIAIFTCIIVGFILFTAIANWFRGPDWKFLL